MLQNTYKLCIAASLFVGLALPATGHATQDIQDSKKQAIINRFNTMDIDKNGMIDKVELFIANPQLHGNAFIKIDINADALISPEEWESFYLNHGKHQNSGEVHSGMGQGMLPKATMGNATLSPAVKKHELAIPSRNSTSHE